jgi:hypothetical protein
VELSTNSLVININKVEHAGFSVYGKLMIASKEALDYYNKAKSTLNINMKEDHSLVQLQMECANANADEIIAKIKATL